MRNVSHLHYPIYICYLINTMLRRRVRVMIQSCSIDISLCSLGAGEAFGKFSFKSKAIQIFLSSCLLLVPFFVMSVQGFWGNNGWQPYEWVDSSHWPLVCCRPPGRSREPVFPNRHSAIPRFYGKSLNESKVMVAIDLDGGWVRRLWVTLSRVTSALVYVSLSTRRNSFCVPWFPKRFLPLSPTSNENSRIY